MLPTQPCLCSGLAAASQGWRSSPGAEECYQTLDTTVIEQFKGVQVKLHADEVVPVTVVNKVYCSQAQSHPYHTHQREDGNDTFPSIPGNKLQAKFPQKIFFCFGPFSSKKTKNTLTCQDTLNKLYQL